MLLHSFATPAVLRLLPLVRLLILPLTLPLVLVGCDNQLPPDPRTEIPLVSTAIVRAAAPAPRSFTGIVAARVQSDLGFRVSGKVLARLVDAGQAVKRGQLLMRIDPVDLRLAAASQQEVVAAAQTRVQQTAADEARYHALRGTGAVSVSAYDQAKAAADTARAQLKAAQAQYDVARNASDYAELRADGDGVVVETLTEPGQVVSAGQVVVRLAHSGQREAMIQLPETLRPVLGSLGQATLFGQENTHSSAKLRQLSNTANQLTRTFEARYVLEGELANAPLGTTVSIQLNDTQAVEQGSVQVPIGALFDAGKGAGVWVVSGEPAKLTVTWRPVVIQQLDDNNASLSGELKQGDKVVALGAHLLHNGEQVRLAQQVIANAPLGAGHE